MQKFTWNSKILNFIFVRILQSNYDKNSIFKVTISSTPGYPNPQISHFFYFHVISTSSTVCLRDFKCLFSEKKLVSTHFSFLIVIINRLSRSIQMAATHHVRQRRMAQKITFCGAKYSSIIEDAPWMSFWILSRQFFEQMFRKNFLLVFQVFCCAKT